MANFLQTLKDNAGSWLKEKLTPSKELQALANKAKTYAENNQQGIEAFKKVRDFVFPVPENPEEAKKMGLINVGTKDNPQYYDPAFGIGGLKNVGKKAVAKTAEEATSFFKRVATSPETKAGLKSAMEGVESVYTKVSNLEIAKTAKNLVKKNPQEAVMSVLKTEQPTAQTTANAIELIRHYQNKGDFESAVNVADEIAHKLTTAGQTIQASKLYTNLNPESILVKAQRLVRESNANKFAWQKNISISEETAKQITDLSKQMQKTKDLAVKTELGDELQGILSQIPRVSIGKKISTAQTISQLLNPKTILTRNPLGNEIFYRLERLNKYVSTPIDILQSVLTGQERTITFKTAKQGEYWSNWLKGAKAGWKGINPEGLSTQFEIQAPAFKGKLNPLTYLEKALGATLKSFDYSAYSRAKNQTIGELAYLKALNQGLKGKVLKDTATKFAKEADSNIIQIANDYGKYITFQDNNVISKGLQAVKRGLNVGQDFGIGDLVLKYPKTPGALLSRGLEYSPAGFVRSAYLLAKPLLKGGKVPIREVELALSRAITGSLGLTGLGYYLADKGIITGQSEKDKDLTALQKTTGQGQYQVNLSALIRWVKSGFKDTELEKGDKLYTYDWAQPIALAISLGANINQNVEVNKTLREKKGVFAGTPSTAISSIEGAVNTITEQPVVSGIKRLFGGYSLVDSAMTTLKDSLSSFTPTLLNQVRQVEENVARETYSPNAFEEAINKSKNRLPVIAKTLPKKYTVFGKEQKIYDNPSLFNVFLNPGFISSYKPTPSAELVLNIYNSTGETKQIPRIVDKSLTFYGKNYQLSGEQYSQFQKRLGTKTEIVFSALASSEEFKNADTAEQTKILNSVLGKLYEQEKLGILSKEQKVELIKGLNDAQKKDFVSRLKNLVK